MAPTSSLNMYLKVYIIVFYISKWAFLRRVNLSNSDIYRIDQCLSNITDLVQYEASAILDKGSIYTRNRKIIERIYTTKGEHKIEQIGIKN